MVKEECKHKWQKVASISPTDYIRYCNICKTVVLHSIKSQKKKTKDEK